MLIFIVSGDQRSESNGIEVAYLIFLQGVSMDEEVRDIKTIWDPTLTETSSGCMDSKILTMRTFPEAQAVWKI